MKSDGTGDGRSRSHFHRSFPNSFHAQLQDVKAQSEDCLSSMNALCRSSALLAETFVTLFQDTPFVELALRIKQVSQDLAARTLNASEHIQDDGIAMVTRLIGRGAKEKTDEGMQVGFCSNTRPQNRAVEMNLWWYMCTNTQIYVCSFEGLQIHWYMYVQIHVLMWKIDHGRDPFKICGRFQGFLKITDVISHVFGTCMSYIVTNFTSSKFKYYNSVIVIWYSTGSL